MIYKYGEKEIEYLSAKDKKLGEAINRLGIVKRRVDENAFTAMINAIIGQQISTKAQQTISMRMETMLGEITPQSVFSCSVNDIQALGTTFKKAEYIHNAATLVHSGELDLDALGEMPDSKVIGKLSQIKGIGVWTAEMLLISGFHRQDVLSYGDLAIHRGLRMVYHHREVTKQLFEKYRRRYSPYGTVASIYLWAVSAGTIDGYRDYKPSTKRSNK